LNQTTFGPSASAYIPGFAGRSSSLGSGSASVSHSGSRAPSLQVSAFQQGSSNVYAFAGKNMSTALCNRLVEELGVDIYFPDRNKSGIRFCWGRYLEITKAIEVAHGILEAGNWPSELPSFSEILIVEVFISKSAWHNHKNQFSQVQKYFPDMMEWLGLEDSDELEDRKVWGDFREKYSLEDLKEFLESDGTLKKKHMHSHQRSSSEEHHSTSKGKGRAHKKKYN
jgi:hypothetical protein